MDQDNGTTGAVKTETDYQRRMRAREARKEGIARVAEAYEEAVMLALDDAEQQYGDAGVRRVDIMPNICTVIIARTDGLGLAVRELRAVQRMANAKAAQRVAVSEKVARLAVVWPAKGQAMDYDAVARTYAAAPETICNAALVLSGAQETEDAGK